ncbi:uncharacterized protein LOC107426006 [Ziziphus jujuba]|uniref:Uncharacterized protein LOC107426006 n=1 Tax=Ziziphus jujuba TaxID=326968 RepID=A0ABM3I013_ZIZJJ|nr:uncharacterized protein LOC107426006 [Ziziphus jujuba]
MGKKPVKYTVVDAFTDSAFKGNPAAVCLLEEERDDGWLQSVATEFNISVTSYLTPDNSDQTPNHPRFRLRWFTPVAEVKLCGHGTLAASHTLFTSGFIDSNIIEYVTGSGVLTAKRLSSSTNSTIRNDKDAKESFLIELNFPTAPITESDTTDVSLVSKALGGATVIDIRRTIAKDDLFVVLASAKCVADVQPELDAIRRCPGRGIIITGVAPPESGFDFYSRFFCPKLGIDEDPVCGSAHCSLALYWCKLLGKSDFVAYAASPRGGVVDVHLDEQNQRVLLRGKASTVMTGTLLV